MKVKELIEILSNEDPETEVYFSYDSCDYWGTMVTSPVSEVEETEIRYSAYHQKFSVPCTKDNDDEDKRKVVILLS